MNGGNEYADDPEDENVVDPKRRRIAKACDQCRRKKIRCNGDHPCSNCSGYKTTCHFTDAPKKRAMPRSAKYIHSLEARLGKMEALLKQVLPDVALDEQGMIQTTQQGEPTKEKPASTPLRSSRQTTMSPDIDHELLEYGSGPLPRQASQEQDEELAEEMGHLWHDSDQEYEEAQFSGAASGHMPLVSVGRTVRELTGNESFDQRINGFRKRLVQQERLLGKHINSLLDEGPARTVENFTAIIPDSATCKLYIDSYFSILHVEFAFINQRQFFEALDHKTWRPKSHEDLLFLSLYLLVLCFGLRLSRQDKFCNDDAEEYGEELTLFTKARALMFNSKDYGRFTFVQCAVLNALYLERLGQMKELWILGGVLVRSAQALGLHRRHLDPSMDQETREVRKRCWWIIYDLDSRLTIMSGNPSAIQDVDCDQELPTLTAEEIAENGDVKFKDGRQFSCSIAGIQLAQINHQIHRRLYSVQAINHLTPEQVHRIVAEIDAQLLSFAENLPDEHKPGDGLDIAQAHEDFEAHFQDFPDQKAACQRKIIRDCYLIPALRLEYLQLVMLLHRRNTKPLAATTVSSPSRSRPADDHDIDLQQSKRGSLSPSTEFKLSERVSRACSSHSIAVQTARTILAELCHRVPLLTTTGHKLLARFASAASLMLFSSIVRDPSSLTALTDLDLLRHVHTAFLDYHKRFPPSDENIFPKRLQTGILTKIMPEILGELCNVCALAIDRAASLSAKSSIDDEMTGLRNQQSLFRSLTRSTNDANDANSALFNSSGIGLGAAQPMLNAATNYFADSNSPFNFGWPANANLYGQPASAGITQPTAMAGLDLAAGWPALSPGFLYSLAASTGTDFQGTEPVPAVPLQPPAASQQMQQQYVANLQAQSMAGANIMRDDYDPQNFWNAFGMYQQ